MNEQDFIARWETERLMYKAWGTFVSEKICQCLINKHFDIKAFLKQDPSCRVKTNTSLIDKAFYRKNKDYENPYEEIEDKVGCRFVVLLIEQIEQILDIIHNEEAWAYKSCRHFNIEKEKDPLLFTYQSVHYVVRAKSDFYHEGIRIKANTPCEIQIRTLLQHAYAELTHDAVYKTKKVVEPKVHRTIAKSMALIETTDEFFANVNSRLNNSSAENFNFHNEMDQIYTEFVGVCPDMRQKSSVVICDEFEKLITEDTTEKINKFLSKNNYIKSIISDERTNYPFYNQSVSIFVIWLIKRRRTSVIEGWPLSRKVLQKLAADVGVSLDTA
ncbi:GTP pyrophosphokinase family protein [Ferrimonas sp. SCSIO 43195]|uniref:GTP pyrophosphokinase n=1 Tax=Ferrimonas sp. SCSIO 43195 TaxID=2822844 RepID=UPI0020753C03|nr:(p)ppGpp synthetase [Ferrimonas sp. SCSIO 43195]USD36538.1 (p)ppGpp synthetase [Ferrimonas sp. SCSIO 43195]